MNEQEWISLFNSMYPGFFEREGIRGLEENQVFDEMILPLNGFDPQKYDKKLERGMSFGFYEGSMETIRKAVEKVEPSWVPYYGEESRIYCGYVDGEIASFRLVEHPGVYCVGGREAKIGAPGCVGTVPEYRCKGIGLTMVGRVTQILKDEGCDYSYIHYTGVAPWYAKLGYETLLRWDRNGIRQCPWIGQSC